MNKIIKKIILYLLMFFSVFFFLQNSIYKTYNNNSIEYSKFISDLTKNKIKEVKISDKKINVIKKNDDTYNTYIPINDPKLLDTLLIKNVKIIGNESNTHNVLLTIFISWVPVLLLIGIWLFFVKQIQNSGKNLISFIKNKAKLLKPNQIKITFKDVAGYEEVKEELREIVDYFKNPEDFKKIGSKIPKGVLMIGPPGTGKTLFAKAIAGESKVSFFSVSGSDFVEMFVGVGASRVRNMFIQAKKITPCIIFIDELDAVGRQRGYGVNGNNDEREQTLNQILVEMDGFEENPGIIIIAATNRPDILDKALLRPGRFDRKVYFGLPNIKEREEILKVHIKNIISKDINLSLIARGTPGFSGADLSNLINEASLLAVRINKKKVTMFELEKARDKIILGVEKKSLILSNKQKELIAFHESGHTIIGSLMSNHDPIYKVSIIPRGYALGITYFLPKTDILNENLKRLENKISTLYGGRIAEEIIYGKHNISTGSYNDIKNATLIARDMVIKWGFSNKLGPILYNNNKIFIENKNKINYISDATLYMIDQEIKMIIESNYIKTKNLLIKNIDILYSMKESLIKYETLNYKQIKKIMCRKNIC
ncbi:ATP-dependent zinc metalloprotease FtsH [Enterobacteriaceae bacterium ET-AT1-13]|nr:ATP-dependent zinc metalloprotease FtsH [Enterobacteriaceae bacterium ET-AT1-13]WGS66457.1 ATP-dependent zinc metalloprotease FtsH [Enterobacteriaceae bacterium Cmel17]WMC17482.1 MAG: ATP-dependent zinc metalloprotease FtsH [Enterobacteriaceae bacterium Cmel21]WMC17688.1 MAG: ATP-dependent zinc metalloprotease FtsH [Enterobacteriaceae bacterium PSmelAO3-2]WMC17892.1 MAG: ATP-dependent zinc metalloprotease FtsH [Enterobacteriaceae bacterium PSmelAO3-1]WMC18095.1 MAG: ATP-dependent zinc metal